MDELTIGDKIYISSKRAAEITGYAKDYVGQLCREGRVEATLVGRSWYVLESSIKEHRFGADVQTDESGDQKPRVSDSLSTWESPSYKAETISPIPELEREAESINLIKPVEEAPIQVQSAPETVQDMQSAWKEWFATRKELLETPEVVDARESELDTDDQQAEIVEEELVEEETPVLIRNIEPEEREIYDPVPATPEIEEEVAIHRSYESRVVAPVVPVRAPQRAERARKGRHSPKPPTRRSQGSSLVTKALLVSLMGLAIAVTVIGAGYADALVLRDGAEYAPLRILGGTSIINK